MSTDSEYNELKFHIALNKLRDAEMHLTDEAIKRRQRRYLVVCVQIETANGRHAGLDDLEQWSSMARYDNTQFEFHNRTLEV